MTDHPARPLTERQEQVARLLANGLTRREVAHELGCSAETVKAHVREIARKLPGPGTLRGRCRTWAAHRAAA